MPIEPLTGPRINKGRLCFTPPREPNESKRFIDGRWIFGARPTDYVTLAKVTFDDNAPIVCSYTGGYRVWMILWRCLPQRGVDFHGARDVTESVRKVVRNT